MADVVLDGAMYDEKPIEFNRLAERWAKNEIFVSERHELPARVRYAGLPTLYPKKVRRFLVRDK